MIEKYAFFRVLRYVVESDKIESIRELSKNLKTGMGVSKESLDYLCSKGIIKMNKSGRNHIYRINTENVIARYTKIIFSLNDIMESGIVDEIIKKHEGVISIILYGSMARGDNDSKSDIDILLITRKKIHIKPLNAERKIGREISFISYTYSEWKNKAKTDKPFYDTVIIDGIPLYGNIPLVT
jgi:predicted nucleotidyltransferase